ncbi:MAG: methyltransferase domain-containing protein [Gammaproteobacteria bacterium]|nr:methyltransferase domain-containing protein [Gammaproteobacteria bacterium]
MANLSIDQQAASNAADEISSLYYFHARPEILQLVPTSAVRVLDVGCGAGVLGATIKSRQSAEVHGVELMSDAANKAAGSLDRVWNLPIESALPELADGYYDCIIAADVLEHVIDPWATLTALKEKLSPDGKMVVSLPNVQNWEVVSSLLEGKWDYRSEGILDRTHLHFFTRKSVEELFWNAGLCIAHMGTTISGPSLPNNFAKFLQKCGLMVDSLERDAETFQFLVVAEKPKHAPSPRVAVIILNWNGKEDTLECLASVGQLDYQNHEVVVVDNGSADDSVDAISKQYPDITLLQTGANLGYAGGNNVGIRWALDHDADFVLLLNNDTIVPPDLLSAFVSAKNLLPLNSALGAKILFYDKPDILWCAGGRWNSGTNDFEHIGYGQTDITEYKRMAEVDYIVGCALFASSATFKEVGLLNESFFLTYEETDWCYRARAKGHKCFFAPDAKLWHKVSSSFGGADSPLVSYFMQRNRLLWAKNHLSHQAMNHLHKETLCTLRRILLPPLSLTKADLPLTKKLLWSFSSWLKTVKRNINNPTNRAILMGLRDYYLGRFGDCPKAVRSLSK